MRKLAALQRLFLVVIFSMGSIAGARIVEPLDRLSQEDQDTYVETVGRCANAQPWASLWTGLDLKLIADSFGSFTRLASFSYEEWKARVDARLMSPMIYKKLHSVGFQMAIRDCFFDPKSPYISNLSRQGVMVGLLLDEVAGTGAGLYLAMEGGPVIAKFIQMNPWIATLLIEAEMAYRIHKAPAPARVEVAPATVNGQNDSIQMHLQNIDQQIKQLKLSHK